MLRLIRYKTELCITEREDTFGGKSESSWGHDSSGRALA
jgi:hypothetical protein